MGTIMELSNFKNLLADVVKSEGTLRDNIQTLVESAIATFGQHGDTSRIEMLMKASINMRSVRSATLGNFIKAHANVRFVPSKNLDDYKVKKIGKGDATVKEITTLWYDFDTSGVQKDLDLLKLAQALITRYEKATEDGKAKVSTQADKLAALISSELEHNKAQA